MAMVRGTYHGYLGTDAYQELQTAGLVGNEDMLTALARVLTCVSTSPGHFLTRSRGYTS